MFIKQVLGFQAFSFISETIRIRIPCFDAGSFYKRTEMSKICLLANVTAFSETKEEKTSYISTKTVT